MFRDRVSLNYVAPCFCFELIILLPQSPKPLGLQACATAPDYPTGFIISEHINIILHNPLKQKALGIFCYSFFFEFFLVIHVHNIFILFIYFYVVLSIEPSASYVQGKPSATEPQPQHCFVILIMKVGKVLEAKKVR
ncbi:hypothetical protein H1C71_024185 [Ictidomys tridecemlineatus]|nr:hypothetical protein H1C71_024185 [Ictidomys tridecemlineatus]KAG3271382.1 hypothetical protein H1C71_024185 [Ictidomys tridecemlineatus]